jgi:hypothetical protein
MEQKRYLPPSERPTLIGWKEWLAFPEIGIPAIKAKIDTGARTSALHTFSLEAFTAAGQPMVRFGIHPLQRNRNLVLYCEAPIVDRRRVKDSGGHVENRYVIQTMAVLGEEHWPVELTLTNRDKMLFRMLLGRTALADRFIIDAGSAYLSGKKLARAYRASGKKKGKK